MPIAAKDLPSTDLLNMLVLGPPRIGKTRLISTAPLPAYVICSDPESKLDSARRVTQDFEYDLVNSTEGPKLLSQMESALRVAGSGKYKTVVWDTLSAFADLLINAELQASVSDKTHEENPIVAYSSFERRLKSYIGRILALKTNVVVLSHFFAEGKPLDGQAPKTGEGIVPGIPGKGRVKIGAMFRDVVYMQKKPESEDRILVCSIKGVWGPGANSLPGRESVPANLSEFLKLAKASKKDK